MKIPAIIFILGLAGALSAFANDPVQSPPVKKKVVAKVPVPGPIKYKYNSALGLGIAQGSSLVIGGQLGFPVSDNGSVYAGPELDFALYSPGSYYAVLGSFWYEWRMDKTPKSSINLGAAAGMVSTDGLVRFPSLTYAVFLDASLSQEVDPDIFVRGQLRPGVIGKHFAFWMNMNVTFAIR